MSLMNDVLFSLMSSSRGSYGTSRSGGAGALFDPQVTSYFRGNSGGGSQGFSGNPLMMLFQNLLGDQGFSYDQPSSRSFSQIRSQSYDNYDYDYDYDYSYDNRRDYDDTRTWRPAPPGPPAPPPPPKVDPLKEKVEKAKADADKCLADDPFDVEGLKSLASENGSKQYENTVNKVYDFGVAAGNWNITKGVFAGQNANAVHTQNLINRGLLDTKTLQFDQADLEKEYAGTYGALATNKKGHFKNQEAIVAANAAWHSTPWHLGKSQQLLDKARELEKVQECLVEEGCGPDSELASKISTLKDMSGLHYSIGKTTVSPIVLDNDGNGKIDLTSVKDGVQFDIDGDGQKEQVAWTEAKGDKTDSWLALPDENGVIGSGKQLFGNQWGDANGYERLKQFDDNNDGVIDSKDAIAGKLRMWQDKNHNGVVDTGELKTMAQAGVLNINLGYTESTETDAFGNELRQQSSFQRTDDRAAEIAQALGISLEQAKTGLAVDAWVQVKK
jgi:hypothetical protein